MKLRVQLDCFLKLDKAKTYMADYQRLDVDREIHEAQRTFWNLLVDWNDSHLRRLSHFHHLSLGVICSHGCGVRCGEKS